jgi:adenosylhomocysteine nucleosidase
MATCSIAIVAALDREISGLVRNWRRVQREYEGRIYTFFEHGDQVCVSGGIGLEAARRAAEATITLYRPQFIYSAGFAGALDPSLRAGEILAPSAVIDARDGSRIQLEQGSGTLLTFPHVAGIAQKRKLASAYPAQAIDMEAAAVSTAARKHEIVFASIKSISDEASFELPGTEHFIDQEGRFRTAGFILFVLLRPWLWPRVAHLALNSRKAASALTNHLEQILENHRLEQRRLENQRPELPDSTLTVRRNH